MLAMGSRLARCVAIALRCGNPKWLCTRLMIEAFAAFGGMALGECPDPNGTRVAPLPATCSDICARLGPRDQPQDGGGTHPCKRNTSKSISIWLCIVRCSCPAVSSERGRGDPAGTSLVPALRRRHALTPAPDLQVIVR